MANGDTQAPPRTLKADPLGDIEREESGVRDNTVDYNSFPPTDPYLWENESTPIEVLESKFEEYVNSQTGDGGFFGSGGYDISGNDVRILRRSAGEGTVSTGTNVDFASGEDASDSTGEYKWEHDVSATAMYREIEKRKAALKAAGSYAKADPSASADKAYSAFAGRIKDYYALVNDEQERVRAGNKYNQDILTGGAPNIGFSDLYFGKAPGAGRSYSNELRPFIDQGPGDPDLGALSNNSYFGKAMSQQGQGVMTSYAEGTGITSPAQEPMNSTQVPPMGGDLLAGLDPKTAEMIRRPSINFGTVPREPIYLKYGGMPNATSI